MSEEITNNECCAGTVCDDQYQNINYTKPVYSSTEEETGIVLNIELPGVKKEDVKINSESNSLSITARRENNTPEDWQLISQTQPSNHYKLELELHSNLNLAATKASFDKGILTLQIAKHESTLPREISIVD